MKGEFGDKQFSKLVVLNRLFLLEIVNLMHTIEELRNSFISYMNSVPFSREPHNLYEPNAYFLQIGGKRLRPVLLLLATELFDGKIEDALPAALAIEYFHNFTLIHDDVMDQAPVRRGFTTVHEKYDLNTAILSGDVLLVKAFDALGNIPQDVFKKVFDIYTATAVEVCEGQQYDIDFEKKQIVTQPEYIEMIRLKSAVLLAASMKMGAVIAHATEEDAGHLYAYAENLGIAFQIQDDILDCYGDESLVGKQPGGDIIQNKKTLLLIEAASKNDARLLPLLNSHAPNPEKVKAMLQIFDDHAVREFAIAQRDRYVERAMSMLKKINLPAEKKEILKSLAHHLVVRNF
jgi:geranylgeranyl diphosphate synthase type II